MQSLGAWRSWPCSQSWGDSLSRSPGGADSMSASRYFYIFPILSSQLSSQTPRESLVICSKKHDVQVAVLELKLRSSNLSFGISPSASLITSGRASSVLSGCPSWLGLRLGWATRGCIWMLDFCEQRDLKDLKGIKQNKEAKGNAFLKKGIWSCVGQGATWWA